MKFLYKNEWLEMEELVGVWRRRKDWGQGFAIGHDDDCTAQAVLREGYMIADGISVMSNDPIFAASQDGDRQIVVCDCNGPWAIDITDYLSFHD